MVFLEITNVPKGTVFAEKVIYLYFYLMHSIFGLKCNIYTTYIVACVPDFEYLIVGSSLFYCFKAEKQDHCKLSMETKFRDQ